MKILLVVIAAWLSANFDLPATYEQPNVKVMPTPQMVTLRYGANASNGGSELVALYEDRTKTIYLSDMWKGNTAADVSVLVHEMVHHFQNIGKLTYECPAAREVLAYAAQERWLGLFGKSLASEFETDATTLKLRTACM